MRKEIPAAYIAKRVKILLVLHATCYLIKLFLYHKSGVHF